MKFLKKLLGVREEVLETKKFITINEGSEELTRRLQEFDNKALLDKVGMLEKVISFLSQKIEIQSEVIRRQSEAIKQMHLAIEEIGNVFENAQKATTMNNDDDEEDEDKRIHKKYLN